MSEPETQESQESADSPIESTADKQNQINSPPTRRHRFGWLRRLFFLLVFFGLVGAGYWYYLHSHLMDFVDDYQAMQGSLDRAETDLANTQEAVSLIRQQMDQQQTALPRFQAALVATQNELVAMAARLREVESSRTGDWVVAEAQYLVRLANQKLLIGTDIASAIELLRDADDLLFELGYPEARRAREALANDMVRLEQVREVDYQGIYFRLSSLIALVDDLPLPNIESLGQGVSATDSESDLPGWRRWWRAIVSRLEPFFVIRRNAETEVMLTNEQLELQKLRIQILLHETQLGLMAAKDDIYRESLDRAAQLVSDYFGSTVESDTLTGQLRELATRRVSIEVPDITTSLRALQDLGDFLRANPPAAQ